MKKLTVVLMMGCGMGLAETLTLDGVLSSVDRHYPPLVAALADRDIAAAEALAARGRFDLMVQGGLETDQFGFYRNERFSSGVAQPLEWLGASVTGGWRAGEGSFAPYDGKLQTRSLGEWSGGIKIPLLRDRAIDSRRGELRRTRIGIDLAAAGVDEQRLTIRLMATRRYWDWVAAGARLRVAESLVGIASARDQFLRDSVKAGQIAAIEVAENGRAILQRRAGVVDARRGFELAGIELSVFYRDRQGNPVVAGLDQLPEALPQARGLHVASLEEDIAAAFARRPEIARMLAQRAQLEVDRDLAGNAYLPGLEFKAGFTAESGQGAVRRGPREMKLGLAFEIPLQRRAAAGRLAAADARLRQIRERERFLRDQVAAGIRDAASAIQTAFERARLAEEEISVARELEEAERARFQLGDGSLFLVNLREMTTADTLNRHLTALNDYLRARAQYDFATGVRDVR